MNFDNLLVDRDGQVALVTLNRPSVLNVLSIPLLTDLDRAIAELRQDGSVRSVLITGAGDKAFAAGADIRELAALSADGAAAHAAFGQQVFQNIEQLGKPVIAAVNGFALGGGCELAMSCTLRIAADTARFGQPEINLGLIPGFGGTVRLPRLVGASRALDLVLSGRVITAAEALGMGLVNKVVPAAELMTDALTLARELASRAPHAVRALLKAVSAGLEMTSESAQQAEAALFGLVAGTDDAKEGTSAFLEKRTPRFNGR